MIKSAWRRNRTSDSEVINLSMIPLHHTSMVRELKVSLKRAALAAYSRLSFPNRGKLDSNFLTSLRFETGTRPIAVIWPVKGGSISQIAACLIPLSCNSLANRRSWDSSTAAKTTALVPAGKGSEIDSPAACTIWAERKPIGKSALTIT